MRLSQQLDRATYTDYLKTFNYGNGKASGGMMDIFWINGDLRISQEEQIAFLKKLYLNELSASTAHMDMVKAIMLAEQTETYTLRAKTGRTGENEKGIDMGWYVGYVEKDGNACFFATHIESLAPSDSFNDARLAITKNILKELKVI